MPAQGNTWSHADPAWVTVHAPDVLGALLVASSEAAVALDLSRSVRLWSPAAERLLGWPAADVLGRPYPAMPEGSENEVEDVLTRALRGESVAQRELCLRRRDGTIIGVVCSAIPLRDPAGYPAGIIKVFSGRTTAGQRSPEELTDSEALWRSLIESHPDQVLIFDRDGTIRFANRIMPGFREEDLIGRDGLEFVLPEHRERARAVLHQVWDAGVPADFEVPAYTLKGAVGWFYLRLAAIRREGKTVGLVASSRDISERKRAEQERAALDLKLQQKQKLESLGVLAGGIAHDFNNLLTGILGNANLARLEAPPGSVVTPYLDQIEHVCLRAADLCRQMLAYAGKGRFVLEHLDLNRLISDMMHLLQASIAKSAVLKPELGATLPAVRADASQLRQVVMNLVLNASEAIGGKSGVICLTTGVVRVGRDYIRNALLDPDFPEGEYVFLEVSDNGPGMAEEVKAKVFDPFFTTKFTGRGLGLAAVQGIVRVHKGAIKVYSEPGRGTTFKVLLPRVDAPPEEVPAAERVPADWRGEGTLLIADDEDTVRAVAARALEAAGFRVVVATNGREAIDQFRADPGTFRLVLLDLTMPHPGGEDVFRELRQLRPDVRVLLMSGYAEQEVMTRFEGKGLAGFLQKPFQLPTLLAKVRQALQLSV
jgi:PAS domain S-box-containing protein